MGKHSPHTQNQEGDNVVHRAEDESQGTTDSVATKQGAHNVENSNRCKQRLKKREETNAKNALSIIKRMSLSNAACK